MRLHHQKFALNVVRRQLQSPALADGVRPHRCFHITTTASLPRKRHFFTSNPFLSQSGDSSSSSSGGGGGTSGSETVRSGVIGGDVATQAKRKPSRATTAKGSLRRVAIIAQQPKRGADTKPKVTEDEPDDAVNLISAVCIAETFKMPVVLESLRSHGFTINPDGVEFDASEVVHARGVNGGDIFVFPSGTIVTWSLPPDVVTKQLLIAAEDPHPDAIREVEDLEFITDAARETSTMKGDLIVLGTRRESREGDTLDTTLAKIAFSSGLARSTKLAVLETALTSYIESTRHIPRLMSRGSGVPYGRRFILQQTGELLSLRARLNHYSELTDSLPDILWDSRSELGLEGYYEQVGRALDVNVRIRTLNQKMDYAQEIASVLRETSSEQHGTRLEWIIIALIAVEVVFELRRIWLDWAQEKDAVGAIKEGKQ